MHRKPQLTHAQRSMKHRIAEALGELLQLREPRNVDAPEGNKGPGEGLP